MDNQNLPIKGIPAEIRLFGENNELDYIEKIKLLNGRTVKSYYIDTYGCQMNAHDSESLAGVLELLGYIPASEKAEADIIVFNK